MISGSPVTQYVLPGWGGRQPVEWVGPAPYRTPDEELTRRRPVVAVMDTGCGQHPWLPPSIVLRNPAVMGVPIGVTDPATDPERTGMITDPYEGLLDPDAGHGTFIAGLIRQACPDANILAIRVMGSDGVVPENELIEALKRLLIRQTLAQAANDARGIVDVLVLSIGYFHELAKDWNYDPILREVLQRLGQCGVAIVAAAGNESTSRPMYPAAFYPHTGGEIEDFDADCVPIVSVGALNPNGTIAMFSNAGPWVACHRPGAAVVSTFPVTFNAGAAPTSEVYVDGEQRATIDPDDFKGGFGVWSGTSFSAPLLAGEIAQRLFDGSCGPIDPPDRASAVNRAWQAISASINVSKP
jgi:subtilisin family serine protease